MTIGEAVASVEARLAAAGVDTPRLDAQMLVAHTLGVERVYVLAHSADGFKGKGLDALCERRAAREPLAYILGWREFYGRRFVVTPGVLIPRQETETLVDTALAEKHVKDVIDIGTGSGCIALTLALERQDWNVTATDISEKALDVARKSAESLSVGVSQTLPSPRRPAVRLLLSDLFAGLNSEQYDLIVSNPPYVADSDPLPPEVRDYEPHTALYAGPDGFAVFRTLAEEAHAFLRPSGALMVEIGDGQSERVQKQFEEFGWHVERVVNDLSGTERVLVLKPLDV